MINSISGKISEKGERWVVIDVGGVGLKINTSSKTLKKMPPTSNSVKLFTYLYVREDSLELYGFLDKEELELFEFLNLVAGIGPKSALGILSVASVKDLKAAIASGRTDLLTKASGIGKKTAERIILELKSKITSSRALEQKAEVLEKDLELVEVLAELGYSRGQAREVARSIPEEIVDFEIRLKEALKMLGNR